MVIYGTYGEDLDFPVAGASTVSTTAGGFRSGWARACFSMNSVSGPPAKSAAFTAGALTSAWISGQVLYSVNPPSTTSLCGLTFGLSGTQKCLGVGIAAASTTKFCIYKYDGTTRTELAAESGTSLATNTLQRLDMQVTNYGVSATVNVFLNGVSLITFTGDVTVSGMTNFDSVFIWGPGGNTFRVSEMFVADSDTRAIQGLQTLALTGAGTTNNWSNNTFTNINGTSFSDANPANVNTTAKDQQYTVTTPTPVTYSVIAVTQSARLARPSGATPTQVKLGYGNGAGGSFGTGAAKTPNTFFSNFTQIDATNPVTGVAFTSSDLASLQLDLESA